MMKRCSILNIGQVVRYKRYCQIMATLTQALFVTAMIISLLVVTACVPRTQVGMHIGTELNAGLPTPRLVLHSSHLGSIVDMAVSGDGSIVASIGRGGWVALWDRISGRMFHRFLVQELGNPSSIALSHDGKQLLVGTTSEATVWDTTSGLLLQRLEAEANRFVAFTANSTQVLLCGTQSCVFQYLSLGASDSTKLRLQEDSSLMEFRQVSLSPDEKSVALALWGFDSTGFGWMALKPEGRQRVVQIKKENRRASVTAVAAISGGRLVTGASNGNLVLIDMNKGKILSLLRTRDGYVNTIVRLDDERIAVAFGKPHWMMTLTDLRWKQWEIMIVSTKGDILGIEQRLPWFGQMGRQGTLKGAPIDRIAASLNGRWLIGGWQNVLSTSLVQWWDLKSKATGMLRMLSSPVWRVEFSEDSNRLIADGPKIASLWNLNDGNVARQFAHHFYSAPLLTPSPEEKPITFADDAVIYIPFSSDGSESVQSWSVRSGLRELTVPDSMKASLFEGLETNLSAGGSGLERFSMHNGSIANTANIDASSLWIAVSNRTENMWLIADHDDNIVLWNANSGKGQTLAASLTYEESVAFSPNGRLLAIAETDGTVSLWDVSRGPTNLRLLARLITFVNGDWAVVAPDGRYDASNPADLDGLSWVMPDAPTKPVPLAIFYREYYEPGLLPRLLAGEAFPPIASIADLDRTQPLVEIIAIEPGGASHVNVSVEVKESRTEGVQDLKLFRNGRLVGLDDLTKRSPDLDQGDAWQVTFQNIELPTSGPDTIEFSAYAFNDDGIKSETHRLPYTRPSVEPNPRRAFVIVVGVNAYQNQSWDLRYAAEDARATRDIIARYIEASGEFEEVHTVSLITERDELYSITGIATRAALLAVLDALAGETINPELLGLIPGATSLSKAGPDDLVYLAFSSHGLSGDNGLFHLFLSDIGEGEKREVNSALLARTLDSDLLAHHLHRVDAGDFVIVIDACNSAASIEGGGFKPGPMGSRGLGQLAYDKAIRVLAASQAEAVALESDRLRHGLLTFAMLHEGLVGGVADRAPTDSTIGFSELLSYGVDRVPLLYEDIRSGSFTPQGRGLTATFTPNGQVAAPASIQRPSLFDFSRGKRDVRMPVMEQVD